MESVGRYNSVNHPSTSLQDCGRALKKAGEFAVGVVAGVVFAVAHPIIGPLGCLANLFGAAYHGIRLNYHWRHTREQDAKGNLVPGTELNQVAERSEKNYMIKNARFTKSDLPRLEHEVQRLYYAKALTESLQWARGLAKCTIPIIGPIWALLSEMNNGGSIAMECEGCRDDWHHITPEEMLQRHIAKVKQNNA